jgi:hypothetical protein
MYSFSYDIIHILKHLRFEKAWELFKKEKYNVDKTKRKKVRGRTFCGDKFDKYVMMYRNRKQLDIWKLRDASNPYCRNDDGSLKRKKDGSPIFDTIAHITIYDGYPNFQQSFSAAAKVLEKMGLARKEDIEFVEEMKLTRGRFATVALDTIKKYTEFELRYLAHLMTILRKTLAEIKLECAPDMPPIHPKTWYGPGPIAKEFLSKMGITANEKKGIAGHYGKDFNAESPTPQQIAAHHAFAGGRIELIKPGYAGDAELHSYDVASAYPHTLTQLPSLRDGVWRHNSAGIDYKSIAELRAIISQASPVSMFLIEFDFPRYEKRHSNVYESVHVPFYPLFFRSARGSVFFPRYGKGWYMRDEALGALTFLERFAPAKAWKNGRPNTKQWELKTTEFHVQEVWSFKPGNDVLPFQFLNEIYQQRLQYKRATPYDVREKFYKLPPNSIYGKTAQGVGGMQTDKGWEPPTSANPFYAAAITAACRGRLMEAACLDPHAVVFFATDGVVTTRPFDGLNVFEEGSEMPLGAWEHCIVEDGLFLQSGVYSMRKAGKAVSKTRGMDPKRLSADGNVYNLLKEQALAAMRRGYDASLGGDGVMLPIRNLVTVGMALGASENNRARWKAGLAGRWSPPQGEAKTLVRLINVNVLGGKRQWIEGREADWQSTKDKPAARINSLIPSIPAENPEQKGVISLQYEPEWLTPELGEDVENAEEQEAINNG